MNRTVAEARPLPCPSHMLIRQTLSLMGAAIVALAGCATAPTVSSAPRSASATDKIRNVTPAVRAKYIASAQVWSEADFRNSAGRDLLAGPDAEGAFRATRQPDGTASIPTITCVFVEPASRGQLGGSTPKFECGPCPTCTVEKTVRVKYDPGGGANGELYAEVIATRLLWALGFKSDDMYPVRVRCLNCPENPWEVYQRFKPGEGRRAQRDFGAVIEVKYDGPKIEESTWPDGGESQGFAFDEADDARKAMPGLGAPDAHWQAFRLLAAFMKFSDTKPSNQRLVCTPAGVQADGTCTAPFLMLQDVGSTFGNAAGFLGMSGERSKAKLGNWIGSPVWKRHDRCQADLNTRFTLKNPTVTESGRVFLVGLLQTLTDAQLRDIFTASRVVERHEKIRDDNGNTREATVDDWVKAFRAKVAELAKSCGGLT
jgi:hypothetical protein